MYVPVLSESASQTHAFGAKISRFRRARENSSQSFLRRVERGLQVSPDDNSSQLPSATLASQIDVEFVQSAEDKGSLVDFYA